jgi:tetratricopeptide (TPR) repeat protein
MKRWAAAGSGEVAKMTSEAGAGFRLMEALMPFKRSSKLLVLIGLTMSAASTGTAYGRGGVNNGPAPAMKVWSADKAPDAPVSAPAPAVPLAAGGGAGMSKAEGIHQVLYTIYKAQRKYDLAEKEAAALTAINPNNTLIHQDWGHELMVAQRYSSALPHYLKVTKVDPTNGDAWACVGDCYMQLKKYNAALDVYMKAVRNEKPGTDYRSRVQLAQQYIDNIKQRQLYTEQVKKQKEESDD